jgi:hypothetical protein
VKHLSGAPFYGRLLALPTNIRLDWKDLPGTNAQAYYEKSYLTAVKSFITLAPGITNPSLCIHRSLVISVMTTIIYLSVFPANIRLGPDSALSLIHSGKNNYHLKFYSSGPGMRIRDKFVPQILGQILNGCSKSEFCKKNIAPKSCLSFKIKKSNQFYQSVST